MSLSSVAGQQGPRADQSSGTKLIPLDAGCPFSTHCSTTFRNSGYVKYLRWTTALISDHRLSDCSHRMVTGPDVAHTLQHS